MAPRGSRRSQAGLTLMEIMIAIAIMVVMMTLAWKTISNSSQVRTSFENFEARNNELRMTMARITSDFESMYLSKNEDTSNQHPRTMLIAKSQSKAPDIRFSTLNHRVLWADANESEQTVVSYMLHADPENPEITDWIRREQRRESNQPPEEEPGDYDILVHDIVSAKIEFFNWKTVEWQDFWDTTQADSQKGWLPSRVRITLTVKDLAGKEQKLVTEARVLMQEPLNFLQ
jgi:prepilin-type N-terminal cleavage/methylation domain-containing protein|nr:type II secretion system protein GspJ [Kofleriaceae bacterium]